MKLFDIFKNKKVSIHKVEIAQSETFYRENITPSSIRQAISDADTGKLKAIQNLYDLLYKNDDNLASDTDVRTEAIKTAQYNLPKDITVEQKKYFTSFLNKHLPDLIDHVMDLKLRGVIFRQILYTQKADGLYYVQKFEDYQNLDLRIINNELQLFVDDKVAVLSPEQIIKKFNNYPVYESLLKYYAFVSFALNNWASFMETYGKPIRIGKYRAGTAPDEKNNLWNMVKSLGTDLAAVISENTMIEFVEHKNVSSSSNLYKDLLCFCRESVTKRILGQILTTTSQQTGSYAQAKVHDLVRQDILHGDLRDAGLYISEICTLLNNLNFNTDEIVISLNQIKNISLTERIAIDTQLSSLIKIDDDYYYDTYGVPKPSKFKIENSELPMFNTSNKPISPFIDYQFSIPEYILESITQKHDEFIATLHSFEDIKNAQFPFELYCEFGQLLSNTILTAYASFDINNSNIISDGFMLNLCGADIDTTWTEVDVEALNAFRSNAFEVAGVTCADTLQILKDEAEKAFTKGYTFDDFRKNIKLKGFEPEKPYYLRTNFDTAINSAYLAREWNELQKVKDIFPYLKYVTMRDNRVRESHIMLNGLVFHIDDPFWDENYPPNGWNCRCGVQPLTAEDAQKEPRFGKGAPRITKTQEGFKKNCAKDHEIIKLDPEKVEKLITDYNELNLLELAPQTMPNIETIPDDPSTEQLKEIAEKLLEDRIINDILGFPIKISKSKVDHLFEHGDADALKRIKYLGCLEDILKSPQEIWIQDKHRIRYIKNYDKNILVLTEFKDGEFEYFNIIPMSKNKDINAKRKGIFVPVINIKIEFKDN